MQAARIESNIIYRQSHKIFPEKQFSVSPADYRGHASLDKFRKKFSSKTGEPYILYLKDLMRKNDIWHLPLYMAMCL